MTDFAAPQPQAPAPPPIGEIPEASKVLELWNETRREVRVSEREYSLNRSFDVGDQYIRWDSTSLDAMIREYRTPADAETRTTVNLMRARRRSLTARLTASPLSFDVRASSNDADGLRKQRLADTVLRALWSGQQWEATRAQGVKYTMFGGNAAVCLEWDPSSLNGPPAVDPSTGIHTPAGGPKLSAMNIGEFGIEPGSRTQRDARWWLRRSLAPPEQVQATYGLAKPPPTDGYAKSTPMSKMLATRRGERSQPLNLTTVLAYYRRPTPLDPGCVVHYVGNEPVAQGPWPFPFADHLNVYVFSCDDPDETWITEPWLSDARPIQSMYNDVRTSIREHVQRASNARILVEEGSMDDPSIFDDTPSQILEYKTGTSAPKWMETAQVPRWMTGETDRLLGEINDVLSQPEVARGVAPGDRNSGAALALLAEKADGPLGPFARDQARGWSQLATDSIRTLHHHMQPGEMRQSTIYTDQNVPQRIEWNRDDIDENVEVTVPVEATEPRSFTAIRAQMLDLARTFPAMFANIDPSSMARTLGLGSIQSVLASADKTRQFVEWENDQMMSMVVVVPDGWHNHAAHIAIHEEYRNSSAYETADPQVQELVDAHIAAHKALAAKAAAEAMAAAQEQAMMAAEAGMIPPGQEPGAQQEGPPVDE